MITTPRYRIGNDMTILWAINNKDGSPFNMEGKEVHLFITHRYGREEVRCTISTLPDGTVNNVIRWDFAGDDQKVLGPYTLTAKIFTSEDMKLIKKDICEAFELVGVSCMECEDDDNAVINDGGELVLSSRLDIYRFGIPKITIGINGNWHIDGVDTGVSAIGGGPGLVTRLYQNSDFGKDFEEESVIDTFNAYAINELAKRITALENAEPDDPGDDPGDNPGGGSLPPEQVEAIEKLLKWFSFDDERGLIKANYGLYSIGSITAGGRGASSSGDVATFLSALKDVSFSDLTDGQSLVYDASSGMWVNRTISGGGGSADVTYQSVVDALGYTPFDSDAFTKANIKNALGIADWALASSKPSYTFAEITSKPTTLSGYGITDGLVYSDYINLDSAYRHIGYGYAATGWKTSGPAAVFGTALYNLRMQCAIETTDTPYVYVSQMFNGEAKGWAELVTYEGAITRYFKAAGYYIGDSAALHRSGTDTFLNYGNRTAGDLYLYGKNLRFTADGGATYPFKILNDNSVVIHDVYLSSGTAGALKAGAYESLRFYSDAKLVLHRNPNAEGTYINYGGRTEGLTLYGSALSFNIGDTGAALILSANKDASFTANLTVAGNSYSKNYPGGKTLSQDPTSAFISTIFDADAVSDSSYRMKILRSGSAYDRFNAAYSPVVAFKTGDTHGFISFGYHSSNKNKCYIGAGNGDTVNWSGILFHDNMDLIPKDDGVFYLGYSDKRWRTLNAVNVYADGIYGYVPEGGTYQRYRLVSSGDRMYLQIGAQDGTATTGKLTISGINVATLVDLTIYSQQTLFSGAVQVNGTSRFVSLATFDKGLKIGDATLSWDSAAGMLKTDKGLYSTGAITAGGKSSAVQSPSTSVASTEWYNIKTKRMTDKSTIATDIYNIIENFNERLLDDQYRIVLMTFKRKTRQGYGWRIPMFSPRYNADTGVIVHEDTPCAIDWNNTWWRVQSSETLILNQTGMNITDIINIEAAGDRFQRSNSKKIRIGFAIFKKTLDAEGNNVGTWGWQRVSNIAEIMLYYAANRDITMIRVIE